MAETGAGWRRPRLPPRAPRAGDSSPRDIRARALPWPTYIAGLAYRVIHLVLLVHAAQRIELLDVRRVAGRALLADVAGEEYVGHSGGVVLRGADRDDLAVGLGQQRLGGFGAYAAVPLVTSGRLGMRGPECAGYRRGPQARAASGRRLIGLRRRRSSSVSSVNRGPSGPCGGSEGKPRRVRYSNTRLRAADKQQLSHQVAQRLKVGQVPTGRTVISKPDPGPARSEE
jgi:hypothetical protein